MKKLDKNKIMTKLNQIDEQFEQGELVEVRDHNISKWQEVIYFGTMPGCKVHWCMKRGQTIETFDGFPLPWKQVRKIQNRMTEKETLNKIFEFETYCTQRFDSEHRVAMAVYDYVKQMKREFNTKER